VHDGRRRLDFPLSLLEALLAIKADAMTGSPEQKIGTVGAVLALALVWTSGAAAQSACAQLGVDCSHHGYAGPPPCDAACAQARRAQRQQADQEAVQDRAAANARYDNVWSSAQAAFSNHDYQGALQLYRQAQSLRDGPNVRASINVVLANLALETGDKRAALAYLQAAEPIAQNPLTIQQLQAQIAAEDQAKRDTAARASAGPKADAEVAAARAKANQAAAAASARAATAAARADARAVAFSDGGHHLSGPWAPGADLERQRAAAGPLRTQTAKLDSASAQLVSANGSGQDALAAATPEEMKANADCVLSAAPCRAAKPIAFNKPEAAPYRADVMAERLPPAARDNAAVKSALTGYRKAEETVRETRASIDGYQRTIDAGGPGAAMATVYQEGLRAQLKTYAHDEDTAKQQVSDALLNLGFHPPPDTLDAPIPAAKSSKS